jgi:hypothetical protein
MIPKPQKEYKPENNKWRTSFAEFKSSSGRKPEMSGICGLCREILAFYHQVWFTIPGLFIKNEGESQLGELIPTCLEARW